jgi:hypothetical protein
MKQLLAGILIVILAGCATASDPAGPEGDISLARARWSGQALQDYRFDFRRSCFCVETVREPVTIEVRGGAISSVRSRVTGQTIPSSENIQWYTIEELFILIEEAEANGIEPIIVEYAQSGYPTFIEIGDVRVDAGTQYWVENLLPL